MINRIQDPLTVSKALERLPYEPDIDIEYFLDDSNNVVLEDDRGNVGLFEKFLPFIMDGHYLFVDKGKTAKKTAIKMLDEIFNTYENEVVRGLIPIEHRASIWMSRHLGFKDYGELDTWQAGPARLLMMTKNEFNSKYRNNA